MVGKILMILAIVSFFLTLWRWAVSVRFPLHQRPLVSGPLPGVTLLKPLKGCNGETKRCLQSWLAQRYPGPVQVLFGVASANDPVCRLVEDLLAEYPGVEARLVICHRDGGVNGKVSTLRELERHIIHPLIILSDADVEAPSDLAASIAPLLGSPGAGLVNCFYQLANPATTAMHWEVVAINADFWSQVLQARSISKVDFALGAVMAMPATMLEQIGGFAPLADFLADDYELGRNVARAGGRIEFSTVVVDCREAPANWETVWKHQLRWARTIRVCRPGPYFFSVLGNATLFPLLWFLFQPGIKSLVFLGGAALFRMVSSAYQIKRLTNATPRFWWFAPIKDLLDFLVWGAAFWGNHVEWHGQRYRAMTEGKLVKVS